MRCVRAIPVCLAAAWLLAGCSSGAGRGASGRASSTTLSRTPGCPQNRHDNLTCDFPAKPADANLHYCPLGERGGGYDVWIRNIDCRTVRRTLPKFGVAPPRIHGRDPYPYNDDVGFFRNEFGWVCWSTEARQEARNVCFRGNQFVMFSFA